jgi:hypothetical protein
VFATEGPGEHVFGVLPRRGEGVRVEQDGEHLEPPITQATASGNNVVAVYADRVELHSGWQGQNVEALSIRDVSAVRIRGMINCTLIIVGNAGRQYELESMALPDARAVKAAIERQKQKAGLYE